MNKIELIKNFRAIAWRHGDKLGLRAAKEMIDWLEEQGEIIISDTPVHVHFEYNEKRQPRSVWEWILAVTGVR